MDKKCTKCGESKPLTEFYKEPRKRDGLHSACKACFKICAARYYAANCDGAKTIRRKWYVLNREKVRASNAKWQKDNLDKVRASQAKYLAANYEKHKASVARWQTANYEKFRAGQAKYLTENLEAHRVYEHNRRARKRENGGALSPDLADRLYKLQKGKCPCCKEPLGDDFHLDHIIPIALGGTNTDDNIQLLRQRCNNQKCAKHPIDFMQQRGFLL